MCNFKQNIDLRCFVARQFLSQIYSLLSVKFSGLKKASVTNMTKMRYAPIPIQAMSILIFFTDVLHYERIFMQYMQIVIAFSLR